MYGAYDLRAQRGETFVRCQLVDANGKSAWTNPLVVERGQIVPPMDVRRANKQYN